MGFVEREFFVVAVPFLAGIVGLVVATALPHPLPRRPRGRSALRVNGILPCLLASVGLGHLGSETAMGARRLLALGRIRALGAAEPFVWVLLGTIAVVLAYRLVAGAAFLLVRGRQRPELGR